MNLPAEIDKFISDHAYEVYITKDLPNKEQDKEQLRLHKIYTKELLALLDKSVEEVIGEDEPEHPFSGIVKDMQKGKVELRKQQRQTWNKIKKGII